MPRDQLEQPLNIGGGASVSEKDLPKVMRLNGMTVRGIGTYRLDVTKQRNGNNWVRFNVDAE